MSLDAHSPASRLMQEDKETYEQYILAALNYNEKLWHQMAPHLCVNAVTGKNLNDFEFSKHYGLFLALKLYRQMLADGGQSFTAASPSGLMSCLYLLSMEPRPVVIQEQLDDYIQLWTQIVSNTNEADALAIVSPTWQVWLQNRKAQHLAKHITRTDGAQAREQVEALTRTHQAIADATHEDSFDTILDILDNPEMKPVERFPLAPRTWGIFNESLGGGFGRGEHTIGIAPSGGGKTVFACQVAAEMAYAGKNVLFVSTEEPFERVLPRFVTMMSFCDKCKIPYAQVRYKPNFRDYLFGDRLNAAMGILKKIHPHLIYKDWTGGKNTGKKARKYDIAEMDAEVERAIAYYATRGEKLDMVILDWLGSTLRSGITDSGMLRIIYSNAATRMKDIALHYDVATLSMAQAAAAAVKKVKIDNDCVAECKSLHNEAHAAFGISHLANAADEGGDARNSFKDTQCFNVFKSRGGNPQSFWMKENFDYQRFDAP